MSSGSGDLGISGWEGVLDLWVGWREFFVVVVSQLARTWGVLGEVCEAQRQSVANSRSILAFSKVT